jgi:iron(III) transport system ATP-binding protein
MSSPTGKEVAMYVQIENLSFAYTKQEPVLQNLDLTIEQGEIVALIGPSGSGKSTLLRLLSGLEVPTQGTIEVNGQTLASETTFVAPEHRAIGMVFQQYALFPHMTVGKNIQYGIRHLGKDERNQLTDELLDLIDLRHKRNAYPHELSGGQQQRVALARSLARKPYLLLLDEPFSNIDASLKEKVRREVQAILRQSNMTCLIVTHDIADATAMADRIVDLGEQS